MFARGPQAVLPALRCCHLGLSALEVLRNHVNSLLKQRHTECLVHLYFLSYLPAASGCLNSVTHVMCSSTSGGAVLVCVFPLPGYLENSKKFFNSLSEVGTRQLCKYGSSQHMEFLLSVSSGEPLTCPGCCCLPRLLELYQHKLRYQTSRAGNSWDMG